MNQTEPQLNYASFWKRSASVLIELLLFFPVFYFLVKYFFPISKLSAGVGYAFLSLLEIAYLVYFHTRWGQTIGKMVMGIRVTRLDGTRIGFREALMRSSVDIVLGSVLIVSTEMIIANWKTPEWGSIGGMKMLRLLHQRNPLNDLLNSIDNLWILSEAVVVLFNWKRRALHDFIAGTVVLDLKKGPVFSIANSIIEVPDSNAKKRIRLGFLVIFILTVVPPLLLFPANHGIRNLPDEKKLELIQKERYSKRGIKTVEEFDEYREKQNRQTGNAIAQTGFFAFLFMSLFYFKKWGYWFTSIYAVFAALGALSAAGIDDSPLYTSRQAAVYAFVMHFSLCCYLFSKKVRSAFFLRYSKPVS